jgi:hypothetical protein
LAACYQRGEGTGINGDKAAEYFEKAAQQNNLEAQFHLAMGHEKGKESNFSCIDIPKAVYWYQSLYRKLLEAPKNETDKKEKEELKNRVKQRFEKLKQRGHVKDSSIEAWINPGFNAATTASSSNSVNPYQVQV